MKFVPRTYQCVAYEADDARVVLEGQDIIRILSNEFLHDQHSHFIIEKNGLYDDSHEFQFGLIPDRIRRLEHAYNDGKSIIVKEIEHWNEKIVRQCAMFDRPTNVHLYMTGPHGTALDWHTDDRDVYVHMQAGTKVFEVKDAKGDVTSYRLTKGMGLFIPYGVEHRAMPTDV